MGGFDAHRAAAGADVPDDAAGGDVHLGQRDRADFGRREQAELRFGLQERFVGVAEEAAADGFARAVGGVRVADEDHHVERVEPLLRDLGERAAGDALVAGAEVFANVGGEVVDVAIDERLGHFGRAAVVGREQADFLGGADFFEHRIERVLREVGEVRFLPRLHHAGERELHARNVRHDDEAVFAELVAHVAGEAVEHRVAVDQHARRACRRLFRSWRRAG